MKKNFIKLNIIKKNQSKEIIKNTIKLKNISEIIKLRFKVYFNKFLIIIFNILLFPRISSYKLQIKLNSISEISILINGTGNQSILYSNENLPNEIFVNGIKYNNQITKEISLSNPINNITMFWNSKLNTCNHMFYDLENIIKIDLSKFDSSFITDMSYMFCNCHSLISIDLSNISTSSVKNMEYMFKACYSLISLDLKHFDISLVTSMESMFSNCLDLTSLDLSNLNALSVTNMLTIFQKSSKLQTINLTNFKVSKVKNMKYMFSECSSLISLDLTSFDTSLATSMNYMFNRCSSLISLNLKSFDTSKVTETNYMFNGTSSLISLDLSNFHENNQLKADSMFNNANKNLIYCINEGNKILNNLKSFSILNNNCSDICFTESKKIIFDKKKCILNCSENNIYKYEYNNFCYNSSPIENQNPNNNNLYETQSEFISDNENNSNQPNKTESIIINDSSYEAYKTQSDERFNTTIIENNIEINTYSYPSQNYTAHSTTFINNKTQNINNYTNIIYNSEIFNFDSLYKNGNYSINSLLYNVIGNINEDLIIKENNNLYHITSSNRQNNKTFINISNIILGKCEKILKKFYNISENEFSCYSKN